MAEAPPADRRLPVGRISGPRLPKSQAGMVTVELALASIGAAAVLVVMAWVLTVVVLLVGCQDTATGVARQEARGDHDAATRVVARRPGGAVVTVRRLGDDIRVVVELQARPWSAWLPTVPVSASAVAIAEPS